MNKNNKIEKINSFLVFIWFAFLLALLIFLFMSGYYFINDEEELAVSYLNIACIDGIFVSTAFINLFIDLIKVIIGGKGNE